MSNDYEDIINIKAPIALKHKRMSKINRAAQFAPFVALTGHEDAVIETARLTDEQIELAEDEITLLNEKLHYVLNSNSEIPVTITYFVPDSKKCGGSYEVITDRIKKVDESCNIIYFAGGFKVSIESIIKIDCSGIINRS